MPMYEFKCEDCGHHFETLVFGNEKASCPKCKGTNLKRLISACGFNIGGSSSYGSAVNRSSCGVGSGFT